MRNPSLKHRVHCVVSVVPADKISLISDGIMQKMRTVREKARDLGEFLHTQVQYVHP